MHDQVLGYKFEKRRFWGIIRGFTTRRISSPEIIEAKMYDSVHPAVRFC
jgi:hypothetical protein